MSRYCDGSVVIGNDMVSLNESNEYTNDSSIKRTKFLSNVKPGDALLLKIYDSYWVLHYVTSVESDSRLTFTPRFTLGNDDPNPSYFDYIFRGQIDDQYDISPDGRFCENSKWYTSRDYTCFYDLPEVKTGDRSWAAIFDAAIVRIDKLLKSSQREPFSSFSWNGGMIKFPLGTVIPEDPGGGEDPPLTEIATNGYYNTGYTESSVTAFVTAFPDFFTTDSVSTPEGSYSLNNQFLNIFMALCAYILSIENGKDILIDYGEIYNTDPSSSVLECKNSSDVIYLNYFGFNLYKKLLSNETNNFLSVGTVSLSYVSTGKGSLAVKIPQAVYDVKDAIGYALNTDSFEDDSIWFSSTMDYGLNVNTYPEQNILLYSSKDNPDRYMYMYFYAGVNLWIVRIMAFCPVDTSNIV